MSLDQRFSSNSLVNTALLCLYAIVAGVIIGAIIGGIGAVFYLVLIFPLAIGFTSQIAIDRVIRSRHIRNRLLEKIAIGLCATIAYLITRIIAYLLFRSQLGALIATQGSFPAQSIEPMIDSFLSDQTGASGFFGYLLFQIIKGFKIALFFGLGAPSRISGGWTLLYWAVEIALAIVMPVWLSWKPARPPLCEHCGEWYRSVHCGSVETDKREAFLSYIQSGAYNEAVALVKSLEVGNLLEVYLLGCPTCTDQSCILTVDSVQLNRSGQRRSQEVARALLTAEQAQLFRALI